MQIPYLFSHIHGFLLREGEHWYLFIPNNHQFTNSLTPARCLRLSKILTLIIQKWDRLHSYGLSSVRMPLAQMHISSPRSPGYLHFCLTWIKMQRLLYPTRGLNNLGRMTHRSQGNAVLVMTSLLHKECNFGPTRWRRC